MARQSVKLKHITPFDASQIDHLEESYAEFAGAHYLYREAQAAHFRGVSDGDARADQIAEMRAWARRCIANIRHERQQTGATATAEGAWGPEHFVWLDSLLGADVEAVKRHVGVLGFED